SLAQKLLQLTMPGVPDVYQGQELPDFSLVDPDNRRPVDYAERERRLAGLEPGRMAALTPHDRKLRVTAATLRLRREHPDAFAGSYARLPAAGAAANHVVAYTRGDTIAVVTTRLPVGLGRAGGWRDT